MLSVLLPSTTLSLLVVLSSLSSSPGLNTASAFTSRTSAYHPVVMSPASSWRPRQVHPPTLSSQLHMSASIEPVKQQGYSASGQTSLSQSSVVVSGDHTPPSWDMPAGRSIWSGVRSVLRDLSPSAAKGEKVPTYKKLMLFASTMGLVLISEPLLSLVDTSVVGWTQGAKSVVQLASMGPATTLMDTLIYMTYFLALGTTNLLSEGLAGKRWREVQETTSNILSVAALFGLGLTGFIWFASPFLLNAIAGASATPELLSYAVRYTRIRALVAPASIMGLVAQSFCMVNHSTKAPVLAVLLASVINVSGDIALSRFGVVGAAIATAVSTVSVTTLLLVAVKRRLKQWRRNEVEEWENTTVGKPLPPDDEQTLALKFSTITMQNEPVVSGENMLELEQERLPSSKTAVTKPAESYGNTAVEPATTRKTEVPPRIRFLTLPSKESLVRLASVSGPLCFNMWAKMGCYSALTLAVTNFGVVPLAAHNILMRLFFFFGCFADSLGMAAQSFLPHSLYPLDKKSFRATLRRLMLISSVGALFLGKGATMLLQSAGGFLARDGAMLHADAFLPMVRRKSAFLVRGSSFVG
ncbi:hypothetical protein ACA910_009025 [Epithemia clementina (nom. ined.)]